MYYVTLCNYLIFLWEHEKMIWRVGVSESRRRGASCCVAIVGASPLSQQALWTSGIGWHRLQLGIAKGLVQYLIYWRVWRVCLFEWLDSLNRRVLWISGIYILRCLYPILPEFRKAVQQNCNGLRYKMLQNGTSVVECNWSFSLWTSRQSSRAPALGLSKFSRNIGNPKLRIWSQGVECKWGEACSRLRWWQGTHSAIRQWGNGG